MDYLCSFVLLDSSISRWGKKLGFEQSAGLAAGLHHLLCRPDSMNLSMYLCCCIDFAVVSKGKFFFEILQLCLNQAGLLFSSVCVPLSVGYCQLTRPEPEFGNEPSELGADAMPVHWAIPLPGQRKTSDK